ncbi:MAG TPA: universal stress protein [Candidatus Binataceae bacterium]|nr:universal stress protein [Candidatus Binataceae bacterium]
MPRLSTILCPVDFDPNSFQALRLASEVCQEQNATLYVLHVVDVAIPAKVQVTAPFDKMEAAVTKKLARLAREKIDARVRYQLQVETGDPGFQILDAAKRVGADLIVLATHGRKGLRRLILGSVAERIVREASCPVLTLRPTARRVQAQRPRARPKR